MLYRLREGGFQAFLVGGCVRDLLLGLEPKDFDVATVYVTALVSDQAKEGVKALNELAKEFRHSLSQTMTMRRVPEIRFRYDDSVDRGERIDALLRGDVKTED